MRSLIDFSKIEILILPIDPRRIDEERLMFYHEQGVIDYLLVFKILIEMRRN